MGKSFTHLTDLTNSTFKIPPKHFLGKQLANISANMVAIIWLFLVCKILEIGQNIWRTIGQLFFQKHYICNLLAAQTCWDLARVENQTQNSGIWWRKRTPRTKIAVPPATGATNGVTVSTKGRQKYLK